MAGRDPTRPQLDFPDLIADLITQLRLIGQVGLLNFSDQVIPTFLIGSRGINFGGDLPTFASAAVFGASAALPAANTVISDTGALPAGTYDLMASVGYAGSIGVGTGTVELEHRNAANTVTLARMAVMVVHAVNHTQNIDVPLMGYSIGLNERFRVISPGTAMGAGGISSTIYAQIRPTP